MEDEPIPQDKEAVIDALINDDPEALEKAGGKFGKRGLSREEALHDVEMRVSSGKTKPKAKEKAVMKKQGGGIKIERKSSSEIVTKKTIIDCISALRKGGLHMDEYYQEALDNLEKGDPTEAIVILKKQLDYFNRYVWPPPEMFTETTRRFFEEDQLEKEKYERYLDFLQQKPEVVTKQTIINYLRGVNLAGNAATRKGWYEMAINELENGNPAEAIAILEEDLRGELDIAEIQVPEGDALPEDTRQLVQHHKVEAEKLKRYLTFLRGTGPQA